MITSRKDMHAYIRRDMERNKVQLGGGIFLVEDTCQSKALFHSESETLRVLV